MNEQKLTSRFPAFESGQASAQISAVSHIAACECTQTHIDILSPVNSAISMTKCLIEKSCICWDCIEISNLIMKSNQKMFWWYCIWCFSEVQNHSYQWQISSYWGRAGNRSQLVPYPHQTECCPRWRTEQPGWQGWMDHQTAQTLLSKYQSLTHKHTHTVNTEVLRAKILFSLYKII